MFKFTKEEFFSVPREEILRKFDVMKKIHVEHGNSLFIMDFSSGLFFGKASKKVVAFQHLVQRRDYTDPEGEFRYVTMDRKMMDPRDVDKTLSEFYRYVSDISCGKKPKVKALTKDEFDKL